MGQQGGLANLMLPLAMFAAIFYFFIMRPQKKKQQAHDDMLASISKGSEVITAGGFFGTVREIIGDSYIIELADGVKVRILKSSISIKRAETDKRTDAEKNEAPRKEKKRRKKLKTDETAAPPQADGEAASADGGDEMSVAAVAEQTAENNEEKV